jgi:O-antigen/teichoic acid export membrane protein
MASFAEKAQTGIQWTAVSVVSNSVVKLLQVTILTRFLSKEDFGTIAIASLFIGFTELFLDMGLSAAIIHKQNIPKKHYSSLFWFNVLTGFLLLAILWFSAPLVSKYYNDDSLIPIIQLLSLNVLFSSLGRQHKTQREKQLNFRFIAITDLSTGLLTFAVAVLLAWNGYGVYSLVWSTIVSVLAPSLIYLVYGLSTDRNITFHFKFSETIAYLKIGLFQIGSRLFDYFARELDIFIISATLGRDKLGVYSLCKKIVLMLYSIISPILMNVLTPLFAEIQSSTKELQGKFTKLIEIVSTLNYPIFFLVALLAPGIIRILYGSSYVDYYLILSLLSINYGILSVSGVLTASQVALGRTDVGFYWTIFRIITTSLYVYIGSLFSLTGIAIAVLLGSVINLIPFWYIQIKKILHIPLKVFLGDQLVPFLVSSVLAIGLSFFVSEAISIWMMILITIIFVLIYIIAIRYLSPKNYTLNWMNGMYMKWKGKLL